MFRVTAACAMLFFTGPALANGDATNGPRIFAKHCRACHEISLGDEVIMKGGRSGPNLYALIGRQAGAVPGYRYSDSLAASGKQGLVWTADEIKNWLENPTDFVRTYLDDDRAKPKMAFRLKKPEDRNDLAAWFESLPKAE